MKNFLSEYLSGQTIDKKMISLKSHVAKNTPNEIIEPYRNQIAEKFRRENILLKKQIQEINNMLLENDDSSVLTKGHSDPEIRELFDNEIKDLVLEPYPTPKDMLDTKEFRVRTGVEHDTSQVRFCVFIAL